VLGMSLLNEPLYGGNQRCCRRCGSSRSKIIDWIVRETNPANSRLIENISFKQVLGNRSSAVHQQTIAADAFVQYTNFQSSQPLRNWNFGLKPGRQNESGESTTTEEPVL